ncbi:hypothetical protein [Microbacterium sp. 1.5R]|uniref:hypothetical protein n=1 Tax=Microbacterium sp. 1.5R TaxID=1916917 RepID=UPI0011A83EEA|nr:hypothetical protein [Microbacterium sp. 1.5R]
MSTNEAEGLTHEARAALQAEPIGVRRLREAREALAKIQAEQAASAPIPVRPADTFHCLMTGATIATGQGLLSTAHITRAGENVVVTQAMIDASYSASGRSWMSLIDNEPAQLAKWGEVRFRMGRAPEDVQTWTQYGDSDWREQREAARQAAWAEPNPDRRAAALRAVHEKFGPAPVTSTTISTTPDPSIKLAEVQRARLDAGGVRQVNNYEAVRR